MTGLSASSMAAPQVAELHHPIGDTIRRGEDLAPPGTLHLAILRSPYAHARLARVDVEGARDCPGVVAVHTGAELAEEWTTLPFPGEPGPPIPAELRVPPRLPVAVGTVRFVGEPVAVVAATSGYAAVDALDAIEVDYEPLPPVLDVEQALAPDAPLVHDAVPGNRCFLHRQAHGRYDSAREHADLVLTRRLRHPWPLQSDAAPPSVVVDVDGSRGTYTVWSDTSEPDLVRDVLAHVTGVPSTGLRVLTPGPIGTRDPALEPYVEDAIALLLAKRLGRPTTWSATGGEARPRHAHTADLVQDVEICVRRDGTILGLRLHQLVPLGAYLPPVPFVSRSLAFSELGPYLVGAHDLRCTGVFTTTPPAARLGLDAAAATFAVERIIDELATELDLDPVDLRRRAWAGPFDAVTSRALELVRYDELRQRQRDRDSTARLGIGVATATLRRPARSDPESSGRPDRPSASVRVLPTGRVEVVTAAAAYGHGHLATFARVAADTLEVPLQDVRVVPAETPSPPPTGSTSDARTLVLGGMAVLRASERVIDDARGAAARTLGCPLEELEYGRGAFRTRRAPHRSVSLRALATTPLTGHGAAPDAAGVKKPDDSDVSPGDVHAAHIAAVEVDAETGVVTVVSYATVDDAETPIGLSAVRAGVIRGVERALVEPAHQDDAGSPADLRGCGPPGIVEGPTGRPAVPEPFAERLGVSGDARPKVGRPGAVPLDEADQRRASTLAAIPAVVNAVADALRPLGVRDLVPPCTPERVWHAVHATRVHQSPHPDEIPGRDDTPGGDEVGDRP
jgi:carbon-monoxide dehydrogenase large subunit